jgi:hypothetical protein
MLKSPTEGAPALAWEAYEIASVRKVMTPALAIYLDVVDSNSQRTLQLLNGNPERWRPQVKTAKLDAVMARLIAHGSYPDGADIGSWRSECGPPLELQCMPCGRVMIHTSLSI